MEWGKLRTTFHLNTVWNDKYIMCMEYNSKEYHNNILSDDWSCIYTNNMIDKLLYYNDT